MNEKNGHRPDQEEARNGELLPAAPDREQRLRAAKIYMRHHHEGRKLADCWSEVHPESKASDKTKAEMASKMLKWLRVTYPLDIESRLNSHGLDEDDMLEEFKRLRAMTVPFRVGVERQYDEGRCIRETYLIEERPDLRSRMDLLKLQAALHGHGSGATRKPLSDEGKSLADARQLMAEPDPIPRTVEEALAKGQPITIIEHPEDISQEEWERDWAKYSAEMKEKRRREGTEFGGS